MLIKGIRNIIEKKINGDLAMRKGSICDVLFLGSIYVACCMYHVIITVLHVIRSMLYTDTSILTTRGNRMRIKRELILR